MDYEPKSIDDQIDCLARLTGAPDSFVAQVRLLFARKGISLDEEATPYIHALEEAFVREESIRASAQAREINGTPPGSGADALSRSYLHQVNRLPTVQGGQPGSDAKRPGGAGLSSQDAGRRTLVVQQQRDDLPMVPGPEEVQ